MNTAGSFIEGGGALLQYLRYNLQPVLLTPVAIYCRCCWHSDLCIPEKMWSPVLLTLAVNLPSVSRTPMRWCTFSCQYLLRIFRYSKRLLGNNQGPASRYSSKSLKLHLVTLTLSISIPLASCLVFDNHTLHLILKSCAKWKKPTEFTLHRAAQWMAFSPFWVFIFVKPANICTISKRGKRLEII